MLRDTPGVANPQIGREEGRPELAIRVDRPKAALLGLSVLGVANTIRTNISGTQAATFRENGKEFPIIVRLREEDRDRSESVNDVLISTPQRAGAAGGQRPRPHAADGPDADRAQESAAHFTRQRGDSTPTCR